MCSRCTKVPPYDVGWHVGEQMISELDPNSLSGTVQVATSIPGVTEYKKVVVSQDCVF